MREFASMRNGIVRFTCGWTNTNAGGYGFKHIRAKHVTGDNTWPYHASLSKSLNGASETWPMLFDWSVALTLQDPDHITIQTDGKICYDRAIFLIERSTGYVAKVARAKVALFDLNSPKVATAFIGSDWNNHGQPNDSTSCQGQYVWNTADTRQRPGFTYRLRAMGELARLGDNRSLYLSNESPAVTVKGAILTAWGRHNWENGILGYPVSEEYCGYRDGGCLSRFQYNNASIYWSNASGAHFIRGLIRDKWGSMGWENSIFAYPTSDEFCGLKNGGCGQHFQRENGSIYYSPGTGTHSTQGLIKARWAELGWERGELGYPTTDEYVRDGVVYQEFEGGWLAWNGGAVYGEAWRDRTSASEPSKFGEASSETYEQARHIVQDGAKAR